MSIQMQGYHPVSSGSPSANSLYASNPYRNQSYTKSPWQNFLTSLGFRTQADAWQENMNVQAAEYDAAIAQKLYDQEYNDPQSQVARMRAAGLNPDIDGGRSIDSGQAAPMGEDPSTPMQSTGDEVQLMNFANGIMNCFTSAVGVAQTFQGIKRTKLQNIMQSIDNDQALAGFAEKMFPYFIPPTNESDSEGNPWQFNSLEMAKLFSRNLDKKSQGKFLNYVQGFWNSAPGESEAYKSWYNRVKNRKAYFNDRALMYSEEDDTLSIIADEFQSMNEKIAKARQRTDLQGAEAQQAEGEYSAEYYANLDPSLAAGAENASNRVSKENNEMVGIMRSSLNNIIKKLDSASKKEGFGGSVAQVTMALLSMFQLYISSQGLPSISRSSGQSSFTNDSYHTVNSHSGFSIDF